MHSLSKYWLDPATAWCQTERPPQGLEPSCVPGVTETTPQMPHHSDLVVFTKAHKLPGARAWQPGWASGDHEPHPKKPVFQRAHLLLRTRGRRWPPLVPAPSPASRWPPPTTGLLGTPGAGEGSGGRAAVGPALMHPSPHPPCGAPRGIPSPPRGSGAWGGGGGGGTEAAPEAARPGGPGVTLRRTGTRGQGCWRRGAYGWGGEGWAVGPQRGRRGPCPRGVTQWPGVAAHTGPS